MGASSGIESNQDAVLIPSQDVQQTEHLPRVYGIDYAFELFSSFSADSFQDYVIDITSNGTRHALDATDALSGNNFIARNYLKYKMNELSHGRMEIQVLGKHLNIIGRLPGYLPGDNPSIVVTGHIDSWFASHGANEGAAGLAVLLELIEKLSDYEWPLDIYFIAENARYVQWGPFGTQEVVDWMFGEGIDPLMVYTLEALLVQDLYAPQDERLEMVYLDSGPTNYHKGQYWAELSEAMSKNYGSNRITSISHNEFGYWGFRYMTHTYYLDRGYHNTLIGIESGFADDDAIRTTNDVWTHPDYRYYLGAEMTASIGASIAFTMSREYGKPVERRVNLEIAIGRTDSYYIPISAPTTINVSSRWFGGNASFSIIDPDDNVIAFQEYNQTSPWTTVDVFSHSVTQPGLYRLYL
ncbi:MAG: M28 family peptidase, partial [Candidatus Thorarchaeota archaeon]